MLSNLRGPEWIIILLIVLLLFGAKRLPDTARGLGRSLRIFKAETKGLRDDDDVRDETSTSTTHVAPVEPRPIQNPPAPTLQQPVPPSVQYQQPAPAPAPQGQDAIER